MKKFVYILLACLMFPVVASAADYYWVGGSGNWSDINKWRTSSGGTVLPAVVPSSGDDVYFDDNSGFTGTNPTITINAAATCRNITFTGTGIAPRITSSSSARTLNIYGNATFREGMLITAYLYFQNTGSAKTIRTNGAVFSSTATPCYIYLNETTSVSLLDDFEGASRSYFYVQAGNFNTNGNKFTIFNFYATSTSPSTINLGSSEIVILGSYNYNDTGVFYTNSSAVTLNAGTSHIRFMGELSYSGTSYGIVGYDGQQFYNVTFENESSPAAPIVPNVATGGFSFNRVEFKGGGYFYGANTFKELILSAGKQYTLPGSRTQTVTNVFTAGTTCGPWTILKSNTGVANLSVSSGATVNLNGLSVQNVAATGIPLTANGSTGIGTTTGWTFTDASVANLYWVGGSGNWGDPLHWATTSGGAGGACVPGPGTNVFFDANSGFTSSSNTVTLDGLSLCKDITFDGSAVPPTVTSPLSTSSLDIYGSSVWQAGMTMDVYTINYRNTGVAKTIRSNGVVTGGSSSSVGPYVYIYETASVSLSDDFIAGGEFNIQAGTFNTNNHSVTVNLIWTVTGLSSASRTVLNLGSSDIYFTTPTSYFTISSTLTTLNAGTSHVHFTAVTTLTRAITVSGTEPKAFYDVSFENPAGTGVAIQGNNAAMTISFNKITATGGLTIVNTSVQANEIDFAPGKIYTFAAGRTVTVNNRFTIGASCAGWTTLKTGTAGSQSTLSMPSTATLDMQGVMLQDINATGGASFTAIDSQDNGNNSSNWVFNTSPSKDLYWVGGAGSWDDLNHWSLTSGGAGGACIPGPADNVFFDAGSGFTSTSNTVTVAGAVYCHNITVAGAATPPVITSEAVATNNLNIYGSSVWQTGMTISVNVINYQSTGEAKTITSNGVFTGRVVGNAIGTNAAWVNIYETNNVSLTDDFQASNLGVHAGIFNTDNHNVALNSGFYAADNTNNKTLNLGSSEIVLTGSYPDFNVSSATVTLNAGTSHIYLRSSPTSVAGIKGYPGQVFNDVTLGVATATGSTNVNHIITSTTSAGVGLTFNKVVFYGGGKIEGNNVFNELGLYSPIQYLLEENKTQTIKTNLSMGGSPCGVMEVLSTGNASGIRANINVEAGTTDFNFIDVKSINASGLPFHFGSKSVIAGQNNNNVTYDPYDSGELSPLDDDWTCHVIDEDDPSTYIISAAGFYGNQYTKYEWKKSGSNTVIGTSDTLNISTHGYGKYTVTVTYGVDVLETCRVSDDITVTEITPSLVVSAPYPVCITGASTLISDVNTLQGQNIQWYETATSTTPLPVTTALVDGQTYYVTQTVDNCESLAVALTVKLETCTQKVYINPNLRLKVSY